MFRLTGIGASEGVAIGKIYIFKEEKIVISDDKCVDFEQEIKKLNEAQTKTKEQLEEIRDKVLKNIGKEEAAIFDGHIALLEDDELYSEIKDKIKNEDYNVAKALNEAIEEYATMLASLDDAYLKERAVDIKDIGKRWLKNLLNIPIYNLSTLDPNTVVVANDLTPSDTAQLDLKNCVGFITEIGGKTAHSAIMARSLEIPAIVGVTNVLNLVKNGEIISFDGEEGVLYLNPTEEIIEEFKEKQIEIAKEKEELKKLLYKEPITKDGHKVEIMGNIGKPADVEAVLEAGATGIGLYRTEFLFMDTDHMPTEEEQYWAYRTVVEKMNNKPVTIRTMDIGGDKELSYLDLPKEMNPFLGYRAIRICLDEVEMFKNQLYAILRASKYGPVKIMYPMVSSIREVRKANKILEECKKELDRRGKVYDKNIKVGIMVETPATAILADKFAKEVDFFSIGTNDLTQYLLAVDRGNEKVSALYNPYNPAILGAIKRVIDAAHANGITVSMCGEFAGDKKASELLLGMGLDTFSMSASSILPVKKKILTAEYKEAKKYSERILNLYTTEEVLENLQ